MIGGLRDAARDRAGSVRCPSCAARARAAARVQRCRRPHRGRRPCRTATRRSRRATMTSRWRSLPRSPFAHPGSRTCTSTSRRSETQRPLTPTNLSICRRSVAIRNGVDGPRGGQRTCHDRRRRHAPSRPLRLVGTWLYLDRYWREERQLAADLVAFSNRAARGCADRGLSRRPRTALHRPDGKPQCLAAASAVLRRLTVVAGGPVRERRPPLPGSSRCSPSKPRSPLRPCRSSRSPLRQARLPSGSRKRYTQQATELSIDDSVRAQLLELQA